MKSDFRTNKSLAADIDRIESSLIKNNTELTKLISSWKEKSTNLSIYDVKTSDLINSHSSSIRDIIDSLENDMISIEGIDIFDMKNSPDKIIDQLRMLKEQTRKFDAEFQNYVKLVIKSKGHGEFTDDIDDGERKVNLSIENSAEIASLISYSLEKIITEVDQLKQRSKDLLKSKIL